MELTVTIFSHDAYVMELPSRTLNERFYEEMKHLKLNQKNYKGQPCLLSPVARLYGTSGTGQKCCVHVHGYFPYIYIKVHDCIDAFRQDGYLRKFLEFIESTFRTAFKPARHDIIFQGELELKYDFYGYHSQKQWFLKIYLYDQANITKLRQLMFTKLLGGRTYQPYEAHINYFMHLFADLNIYGLHPITIMDFKFRRNIDKLQEHFKKLNTKFVGNCSAQPLSNIDLSELFRQMPAAFSMLEKCSTCYLQVDVHFTSIVNYLYNFVRSGQNSRMSADSDMAIDDILQGRHQNFQVKITKALDQFWNDERDRRNQMGIQGDVTVKIDLSRNVQNDPAVIRGQRDALWINFMGKGDSLKLMTEALKSYRQAQPLKFTPQMQNTSQTFVDYTELQEMHSQAMEGNLKNRHKIYGARKAKYLEDLRIGQKRQIPEWDERSITCQDESQSEEDDRVSVTGSMKSQNVLEYMMQNRSVSQNSVALFRNNYKVQKGQLKQNGFFTLCQYCKQFHCICQMSVIELPQNVEGFFKKQHRTQNLVCLEYSRQPPSQLQNEVSVIEQFEYPYYSSVQDYMKHHNISSQFPRTKKIARILAREVRMPKHLNNIVSIKNSEKLPDFWREIRPFSPSNFEPQQYVMLEYDKVPPEIQEHVKEPEPFKKEAPSSQSVSSVFACDIVKIKFELVLECHGMHVSNFEQDAIAGILFTLTNEITKKQIVGLIGTVKYFGEFFKDDRNLVHLEEAILVADQHDLLFFFALLVFKFDPDMLISYDNQKRGLYYIVNRAAHYGLNYCELLGRCLTELDDIYDVVVFQDFTLVKKTYFSWQNLVRHDLKDKIGKTVAEQTLTTFLKRLEERKKRKPVHRRRYIFNIVIKGRVLMTQYRVFQFQLRIKCHTIEAIAMHLFGQQMHQFTDKYLYDTLLVTPLPVIHYHIQRLNMSSRIQSHLNIISAIVEKSKLYGCNFQSMMERGSQFKIQSIMYRVSRLNDYLLLSASKQQVAAQNVLECVALVLEPPKQYYTDPVLVFDFQSLYPSVMIAYNLCYTTCLGSLKELFDKETRKKRFGIVKDSDMDFSLVSDIFDKTPEKELVEELKRYFFVTPNQIVYLKRTVKEGIVPRILLQFLMSRIMIKNSSKLYNSDDIKRMLNERQVAIKLFMNVMYGYTGASYSGRMPNGEIADSIVQISKYLLTSCIEDMNDNPRYGRGRVIYGDTDSIFFHLKGCSMEEAFRIGEKVAQDMTTKFPFPVELKFQKAYDNLILVAKKRYYGRSYEKFGGKPKYQGKGLECVRRDGIDLTSNLMKNVLNGLFDNKDLSKLKENLLNLLADVKAGMVPQNKFCFAKEVKMLKYKEGSLVAHAMAAKALEAIDPSLAPKYGQRLKYLIVKGQDRRIGHNVVPLYIYKNEPINYDYYVTKMIIPPLQRALTAICNLTEWISDVPVKYNPLQKHAFSATLCMVCWKPLKNSCICTECINQIQDKIAELQRQYEQARNICIRCVGREWTQPPMNTSSIQHCIQWNCSNLYRRRRAIRMCDTLLPELRQASAVLDS